MNKTNPQDILSSWCQQKQLMIDGKADTKVSMKHIEYTQQRYGLSAIELFGKLDNVENEEVLESKALFDKWAESVYHHKWLKSRK